MQAGPLGDVSGWRGMLVVETIGRIRREHLVKGKPIKEIVRELKVSRNTVRKVLRSGATSFEYARAVQPRPKLGAWHGDLDRMLSDHQARPARERLTLIRMFEGSHASATWLARSRSGSSQGKALVKAAGTVSTSFAASFWLSGGSGKLSKTSGHLSILITRRRN